MPTQAVTPASRAAALEAVVEIAVWQGDYAMAPSDRTGPR